MPGLSVWRLVLFMVPGTLVALASACFAGGSPGSTARSKVTVRGLVTRVNAGSTRELESLRVIDESGTEWMFRAGGKVIAGLSTSHLREHTLQGTPVTVTFHGEKGVLIIEGIDD